MVSPEATDGAGFLKPNLASEKMAVAPTGVDDRTRTGSASAEWVDEGVVAGPRSDDILIIGRLHNQNGDSQHDYPNPHTNAPAFWRPRDSHENADNSGRRKDEPIRPGQFLSFGAMLRSEWGARIARREQ